MKIFSLGATGKTGSIFLEMALAGGHSVTAFVRSPEKVIQTYGNEALLNTRLSVLGGDLFSQQQVSEAMRGHDAVVSCLGGNGNDKTTIIRDMTQVVVASMETSGVPRFIGVSSAGIHNEFSWATNLIVNLFYKHVIQDHRLAAQLIMTSGLTYTLARPLSLTDGPLTKNYRLTPLGVPRGGKDITRHDLAHFLLTALESGDHKNATIGLAY